MTPVESSPTVDSVFDAFLFAPIGEEANGMQLSVLSALSRLGIDPWSDAARLALLPKDSAIVALGESLALLPRGKWQPTDTTAIATRLIELLPKTDLAPEKAARPALAPATWQRRTTWALALASAGLAGYLLFGVFSHVEHRAAYSAPVGIHAGERTGLR